MVCAQKSKYYIDIHNLSKHECPAQELLIKGVNMTTELTDAN